MSALRYLAGRWWDVVPSRAKFLAKLVMEAARRFMPTKKNPTSSKPAAKKGSKHSEGNGPMTLKSGAVAVAARAPADLTKWNEALRLNPNDAAALAGRAKALLDEHRYLDAVADLGQLIQLQPKEASHFCDRARAREALDQFEWALDDYRRALSADKSYAPARRHLVALLRRLGREDEASREDAPSSKSGKK